MKLTQSTVASEYISRQDTANNIAQMWEIVDVRKGARNQNITFSFNR